ncbi:MAG: histidine--tRNA ligase [Candidatus Uhrbacteria bacterium]
MAIPRRQTNKKPAASGKEKEVDPTKPKVVKTHLLRGFKDILPSDQPYWNRVRQVSESLATAYGYERIDVPILEESSLFQRTIGSVTDIVEKEMFSFVDSGEEKVSMRPEATAGVTRAYVEHGMRNQPQPVKLWYRGPMFRYDRPQAGRQRQFHQFGLEIFGDLHPATDAELLVIGVNFFRELGIPVVVQVNSIGCASCRPAYEEELVTFLKTNRTQICETCKHRTSRSPIRVFDCKEESCHMLYENAPQMVDWLCDACKQHFIRVLEYLDELEVPYALSPFLVRGLDYYTKTVYEFLPASAFEGDRAVSAQAALAAGGRYDMLAEQLGGEDTPAAGLAFGIERTIMKMREAVHDGAPAPVEPKPLVYLAQLGDQAKRQAMRLFEQLRREGLAVVAHFSKDALKAQLEHANRLEVKLTLILGQKEVIDETIIIREMSSGIQEIIAFGKVRAEIEKRLAQDEVRERIEAPTAIDPEASEGEDKELNWRTGLEDEVETAPTDDKEKDSKDGNDGEDDKKSDSVEEKKNDSVEEKKNDSEDDKKNDSEDDNDSVGS